MAREKLTEKTKKKAGPPQDKECTPASIRAEAELAREMIKEAEGYAKRLEERGAPKLVVPAGEGSEAFPRLQKAIRAWENGLRNAYYALLKDGT